MVDVAIPSIGASIVSNAAQRAGRGIINNIQESRAAGRFEDNADPALLDSIITGRGGPVDTAVNTADVGLDAPGEGSVVTLTEPGPVTIGRPDGQDPVSITRTNTTPIPSSELDQTATVRRRPTDERPLILGPEANNNVSVPATPRPAPRAPEPPAAAPEEDDSEEAIRRRRGEVRVVRGGGGRRLLLFDQQRGVTGVSTLGGA